GAIRRRLADGCEDRTHGHPRGQIRVKLHRARNDSHRAEPRGDSVGTAGATRRVASSQAFGNAGRRCPRGVVPGFGGQRLDHGDDSGHLRWRSDEDIMDLHRALVLTHVSAMIGLFSALTIEGLALRFLRRAITYEQAREWTAVWTLLPVIGAPSILLSLV